MKKFKIDHNTAIPLHYQIEKFLRELIERDEYVKGKLLPKEVDLAKRFSVSRNTIRQSINKLVMEGRLVRKKGIGTKVTRRRISTNLDCWKSFTQEMTDKGIPFKTWEISTDFVEANDEVADFFKLKKNDKVLKMSRLRGLGQGSVVYFESYFHPRIGLKGNEDFSQPLYEMLEKDHSIVASLSQEHLSVLPVETWIAKKINVKKGASILFRKRFVFDIGNKPIELNYGYYNPENFTYSIDIKRD